MRRLGKTQEWYLLSSLWPITANCRETRRVCCAFARRGLVIAVGGVWVLTDEGHLRRDLMLALREKA